MLLEKSASTPTRPRGDIVRPLRLAPRQDYPPIVWSHPSPVRSVVDGLGGIGQAMGAALLLVAALIGVSTLIALLLATVVQAFGIDASTVY